LIKSAQYWALAADQDLAETQFNYAVCLEEGRRVEIDLVKATEYLKLAADQNLPEAQFSYASSLANAQSRDLDLIEAVFQLTADRGEPIYVCLLSTTWSRCGY
jgi:TPR repeat protein